MESMPIDWLSYGITFIVGSAVGSLLMYWLQPASLKSRNLEKQLSEAEQNQADFQEKVSTHFEQTAELFSGLTDQYQKVYKHLANGSQTLCNNELTDNQLKLDDLQSPQEQHSNEDEKEDITESDFEMPKDYAHSADQSQQGGTLSEDFGLQKKRDTPIDN